MKFFDLRIVEVENGFLIYLDDFKYRTQGLMPDKVYVAKTIKEVGQILEKLYSEKEKK